MLWNSSFFALFFSVIRRLVLLISRNATLIADKKASISQAQNASKLVETLMAESSHKAEPSQKKKNEAGDEPSAPNVPEEELQQQLTKLRIELSESKEVAARYKRDLNAVKDQAKSVTAEYDRLLNEFGALELKYDKVMKQASGDKKKD